MTCGVPHGAISPLFLVFPPAPASIVASDRSTADHRVHEHTTHELLCCSTWLSVGFGLSLIYKTCDPRVERAFVPRALNSYLDFPRLP